MSASAGDGSFKIRPPQLARLCRAIVYIGERPLIICAPAVFDRVLPTLKPLVDGHVAAAYVECHGGAEADNHALWQRLAEDEAYDSVVALGDDATADAAMAIAKSLHLPAIFMPMTTPEGALGGPLLRSSRPGKRRSP